MLLLAQTVKFAGPLKRIAIRQFYLSNLLLQLLHGCSQVAATDAEFDRHIAPVIFPIDHECAFLKTNISHLAKRYASAITAGDEQGPNCFWRLAKFRFEASSQIKTPVAFYNLRDGTASYGALDNGINVSGLHCVTRSSRAVNRYQQIRLAVELENADVFHSCHLGHHTHNLIGLGHQSREIVAKQFQ